MAAVALEFHLEGMIEDGESLSVPTPKSLIEAEPDNEFVVEVIRIEVKSALLETA